MAHHPSQHKADLSRNAAEAALTRSAGGAGEGHALRPSPETTNEWSKSAA